MTVGGFPFCCLSALPLAYFPAPYPPARARRAIFPGGEGGDFSFLMQGASPLASPGAEPGRHWFDFKKPILFGIAGERRLQSIKIMRKVLGGLGASFKKPPSASPPLASPGAEPGRHWLDFKKPMLFGVAGERRLQSIKIREKFLGVWGLLSRSPQALPRPLHPRG